MWVLQIAQKHEIPGSDGCRALEECYTVSTTYWIDLSVLGFDHAAIALPAHLITLKPPLPFSTCRESFTGRPEGKDGGSSSCALQRGFCPPRRGPATA
jgi:hypothetical protein